MISERSYSSSSYSKKILGVVVSAATFLFSYSICDSADKYVLNVKPKTEIASRASPKKYVVVKKQNSIKQTVPQGNGVGLDYLLRQIHAEGKEVRIKAGVIAYNSQGSYSQAMRDIVIDKPTVNALYEKNKPNVDKDYAPDTSYEKVGNQISDDKTKKISADQGVDKKSEEEELLQRFKEWKKTNTKQ